MKERTFGKSVLLFALLTAATVQAQDPVIWSGGIGSDERAEAPTTGTKLEFFVASGSYLSGVRVTVHDGAGKAVVDTTTNGPWLILDLPPGEYRVHAEVDGKAQGGMISVEAGDRQQLFSYMFPGDQ